jgi:hypothetical protein
VAQNEIGRPGWPSLQPQAKEQAVRSYQAIRTPLMDGVSLTSNFITIILSRGRSLERQGRHQTLLRNQTTLRGVHSLLPSDYEEIVELRIE